MQTRRILTCLTIARSSEPLSKPSFDEAPDDEGCRQRREGELEVVPPLVADGKAPELGKPDQRPLDHPPVPAQTLTALDPAAGDAVLDATAGANPTTAALVVGLVGVQPGGAFTRPSPALADRRDGIHDRLQHPAVVHVGARQLQRERDGETLAQALRSAKDPRIKYIIWNKKIANSSAVGGVASWAWRAYKGKNPHDHHVHFSVKADGVEGSRSD